uniref:Uncharacterized protein n=1 Tax=Anguilla anguilla TaxID=7936 RepID=A0A0E9WNH6_ANGAN
MVADFKLITKTRVICGPPEPGLAYRSLPPLKPDWLPPLEQMVSLCPAETRLAAAFGTDDQWGCGDLTPKADIPVSLLCILMELESVQ